MNENAKAVMRIYPATEQGLKQALHEQGECGESYGCKLPRGHNPVVGHGADAPPQWVLDKLWVHVTSTKVKVTYFKPSGKYYTEEETDWPRDDSHFTKWKPFDQVARLKDMIAVCMEAPHGFPQMHVPTSIVAPPRIYEAVGEMTPEKKRLEDIVNSAVAGVLEEDGIELAPHEHDPTCVAFGSSCPACNPKTKGST